MKRRFSSIGNLVLFFFILILLSSCGSLKNIVYFQKIESRYNPSNDLSKHEILISNNDNLLIMVSSKNPQAADIFNILKLDRTPTDNALRWQGYLVDELGYINFPLLGKIHLSGMTKSEAIKLLQDKISEYAEDPVVNIRFLNYKVTVIGEVNRPGVYFADDEKLTIVQALGLSGDLTIYGKRRNVLVYRELNGTRKIYRVDMTSPEIFNSPVYYLQQNDVVYVEPNKAKAGSSAYNQSLPLLFSLISVTLTVITFLTRL